MSKTKEMFLRVTQQHVSATDKYEQYMAELKKMEESIHNQIKSNERSSIQ